MIARRASILAFASVASLALASGCGDRITLGTLPAPSPSSTSTPDGSACGPFGCDAALYDAGPYDPCAGKSCGEICDPCAPHDPSCTIISADRRCDRHGACASSPAVCGDAGSNDAAGGAGAYDPCAGKACGEACKLCPPDDPLCVESEEIKTCGKDAVCSSSSKTCS
jgi:hypothetical protein